MRNFFQKLLSPTPQRTVTRVPDGQRVYAVGDIHGRADLFGDIISAIEADDRARGASQTTVILLGDLVDRGPDSRGVIDAARDWSRRRAVRILLGNHEEMLLKSLEDEGALRQFTRMGGRETILSYGITRDAYLEMTFGELRAAMAAGIPFEDLDFMRAFEDMIVIGDYVFVHAGIRPSVDLDSQSPADLRWIREPFLSHVSHGGTCVVHGHTVTDAPDVRPWRVGIDTGAYASGLLTAVGLEGAERWFLEAQ
jgi:serine/threonine protein phosphatase 1